jgi:hypothetical protein
LLFAKSFLYPRSKTPLSCLQSEKGEESERRWEGERIPVIKLNMKPPGTSFKFNIMPIKFTNTLWMSTVNTVTVKNNNTFALPLERQQ